MKQHSARIKCPFCGCTTHRGFDCVEHVDKGDADIRDVYECPECKKRSIRYYRFSNWEDEYGNELV